MNLSTEQIFHVLDRRGAGRYGLSAVTQKQHALQSAQLAAKRGLGDALVIAALFHDLGHLLVGDDVDLAERGIDDRHEETSATALEALFGRAVAEPVRLHVAAKRYLAPSTPPTTTSCRRTLGARCCCRVALCQRQRSPLSTNLSIAPPPLPCA